MTTNNEGIAIVGMACQFPGALNLFEYWQNLINGKEAITYFTDEELENNEYDYLNLKNRNDFVKARGILKDIDKWDAKFFGYTPQEAANTDPQQRLWLQTVWSALEDAGCNPYQYKGKIGVYAGTIQNTYLLNNILRNPETFENYIRNRSANSFQTYLNNEPSYLATKTAYIFDLKGPAITIQTACSTSLVAVAQACSTLSSFEADTCIAGGVTVLVPQETGYVFQEGAITSSDGHCRPFDVDSNGTVFGNGVGVVVLKRFDDAVRDKNRIYGVIKGWALNNDGKDKVGFMAPSIDGQAEVISMAQSFADVNPEDISYIEAHGTATPLGDPIEVAALTKAFRFKTNKKQFCGIGSVKSNLGHLDAASGIAGLIKVALSAHFRVIPPTINFKSPNPRLNIENTPFFVVDKLQTFDKEKSLIMGVSSLGIGGTNAHVIIQDYIESDQSTHSLSNPQIMFLSAKSGESLKSQIENHIGFVNNHPEVSQENIAYTLQAGRDHMQFRAFGILKNNLSFNDFKKAEVKEYSKQVVFMFPGQGSQFTNMGKQLYESEPVFKNQMDECFSIYTDITGNDIKTILFKTNPDEISESVLSNTEITQPSLFIVEYSLAKLYLHYGIEPDCMVGHSIGEYVAACISGVFDLTSALKIVIKRGQLMQSMPSGKMMAVLTGKEDLLKIKNSLFEIAAINAPSVCTISFQQKNQSSIKDTFEKASIKYIDLNTSHAFHSSDFDPILPEFEQYIRGFKLNEPSLPFISCVSGDFISSEEAISPSYWARQLRSTVLFSKGITKFSGNEGTIFIELGPNTHLSTNLRQHDHFADKVIVTTLAKPDGFNEQEKFIRSLGNLWLAGKNFNFELLFEGCDPRTISLPGYPFDKKRYWIDHSNNAIIPASQLIEKVDIQEGIAHPLTIKEEIAQIWKDFLGLDHIEPSDNFFSLGGHSLMSLQILTRIRENLNQNISLKTFLDNPTLNGLYSCIKVDDEQFKAKTEISSVIDLNHIPLSDSQKRLWIISRLDGLNPAYNIPFTYHLNGKLNIQVFRESINVLFQRHVIMFSTFHHINGVPFSKIVSSNVEIELIDFSGDDLEVSKEKVYDFVSKDSRRSFDIESGPLYRLYLLKCNNSDYYFHVTINHLIFDGGSWGIFIRDLNKIYNSIINNTEAILEKLTVQYYNYAKWQETVKKKPDEEEELTKFWNDYLRDCQPVLNFPYDQVRSNNPSGLGEKLYIRISKEHTSHLKAISKKENSTPYATLLSAYAVLLQKYTGGSDLCIGTPVANRPQSRLENIFGLFVNTLVIRVKMDVFSSFRTLVSSVNKSVLDALSHQDLSFEKIVDTVNPERKSGMNPLFQACFAWQSNLSIPLELKDLRGERITVREGISPFDLTLYMWENEDFIEGEIEYASDLLKYETVLRIKNSFLNLINNLVENPDISIDSLSMVSDEDKKLINSFNDTRSLYPKDKTIIQLFEEQATLYADKTAVVFKEESLTYQQLNFRTNQLAHTLREKGVGRNTPVGILAEKSLDVIVGILAILKAGGVYVPIDPDYPKQRIDFIINDSGCKFLLTQDKYMTLPVENAIKISLNSPDSFHKNHSNIENINTSSDLAYIMYTSGTTGNPKGSMIMQYSIVRLVRNTNYIDITAEDRVLSTSAIVFDAATFEIWGALLNGGTFYIAEKETIINPKELGAELVKNNITILWLTSALFTHIAESRVDIFGKLKYLLVGGDVISAPHINKVRNANPRLKVINGYGPTENTTFSVTYLIEKDFEHNIPIGKPISNSTAYIFDKSMNYQPIGVIGELYVGGDGVAAGYLNRDDLNKKSFMDHPHIPGERLYRTGDYARWLPDGNIEFHGRVDNQLKIRGFRVELEEIESVISEIDGVIETVIKPVKVDVGDYMLIAFLNVQKTFNMDSDEIVRLIKSKLPSYMMPAAYKFMQGFPRTINGKIDRNALAYDLNELKNGESKEVKTLTPTEKIIHGIWSETLKTNGIAVTDNFFEIGGNSLVALSVFSKITAAFKVEMSLRVFFDSPRIKDLAEVIDIQLQQDTKKGSVEKSNKKNDNIIKGEI